MKSTREKVLQTLAATPKSTIVEIAESVDINAISVRHHLTSLQAAGLVEAEEERHGVGRPRLIYSLTEEGMENFPTRYYQLTNNLIQQIKSALPNQKVNELFKNMGKKLAEDYREKIEPMSFEERLDFLQKMMANEGYKLEWKKSGDKYTIHEISCPFYQIGKEHPEICLFDKTLIASVLKIPEDQIEHIRDDESFCKFKISRLKNEQ